jgi:uncharacterized protein with ParB-like and HNH nuclease domain/predicted transport protein
MKAAEANFLKFLKKSDQLEIPIYQRTYSWTREQCIQLWGDIVQASGKAVGAHFMGSIVYIDTGVYVVTGSNRIEVIDGQQRLTTISLILLALGRAFEARGGESAITGRRIIRDYLLQEDDEDAGLEARYKLLLTKGDRDSFMRLVDGQELDPGQAPRLVEMYRLFEDQLKRTTLPLASILAGIEKLLVVDIALERDHDNPQLIFESLNSTGLDLSQADLIRNYVLMGLPSKEQTQIYTKSWYPLEQSFQADPELFDRFVRDYLTMKTGQIPKIDRVYESFKAFDRAQDGSRAELVADAYAHSKNWVLLAFGHTDDAGLQSAISDLNQLKVDVAYPFLLEVMHDREEGTIDGGQVIEVIRIVESYVFRRAIAGIPTNILNKTFATLAAEIDELHYIESLRAALLLKESYGRMPTDEEVRNALVVKDVYNFRSRNYLLRKLENFDHKEPIDVDIFTIEHVMPQNPDLSPEWQEELGPDWKAVRERWLHTIGNLTLTGYNSELSDRPFAEKLTVKGGFRDSHLRLNHYLAGLEHWTEPEIQCRAEKLADLVLTIWPAPKLADEVLARYRKPKPSAAYAIEDHPALSGPVRPLFEELRKRIQNLDTGVLEEVRKQYIAYRSSSNFVEIVPQLDELKLYLDIPVGELDDPDALGRDVAGIGHWGTGSVEVLLTTIDQLEAIMALVRQAFERQTEEGRGDLQWSRAGVERVVDEATNPDIRTALLSVVEGAVRSGLYPRPWKHSLMFAPPANRSRCLFTLSIRQDDRVDLWSVPEAFQSFYGIEPSAVERLLGPAAWTPLHARELDSLVGRLEELMADAVAVGNANTPLPTWNGRDFYVTIGDRSWEDAQRFGFVSAGGGAFYTKPLENLVPGARVFLYKPRPVQGYVGVGIVRDTVRPVTEYLVEIDGRSVPILDAPLTDQARLSHDVDDPDLRESLVRMEWIATRPIGSAIWRSGLFTNQMPACKLRDPETIAYLEEAFGLQGDRT